VTFTDMAVLAGAQYDICHYKYGAVNTHKPHTHEKALRIILHTIATSANKYQKQIQPLLSLTVDFYVRLFIRIWESPTMCHETFENTSHDFQCVDCQNFKLHQVGSHKEHVRKPKKGEVKKKNAPDSVIKAHMNKLEIPGRCDNCEG